MQVFDELIRAPKIKELILNYDFPTSNLYPNNRYPKSKMLNYVVENAQVHKPVIIMVENIILLVAIFKIQSMWFVAVQQNGTDLESNLDTYLLPDHDKFYGDLSYEMLNIHGCSGYFDDVDNNIICRDCGKMLAVF